MQLLSQAQANGILSATTLTTAHQHLHDLTSALKDAEDRLNGFCARLKKQNIDAVVLDRVFADNLSEQLVCCLHQLDDEVLPLPAEVLELRFAICRALYHFLNQYSADFEEVLPDPQAHLFD